MRRKRQDYLTFYKSPDDAAPEERMRVRLACRLLLTADRVGDEAFDEFFSVAQSLVVWSRGVLEQLTRARITACVRDAQLKGEFGSIDAGDLLESGIAESGVLEPLKKNKRLRSRWIRETIEWIDSAKMAGPLPLQLNVDFLADSLGLTQAEKALTMCIALARDDEALISVMRSINFRTTRAAARTLSAAFDVKFDDMREALQPHGMLARLGIANLESFTDLEDIVRCSNSRIYSRLQEPFRDAHHFLSSFLKPAAPAKIQGEDVKHLGAYAEVAKRLIGRALQSKEPGVHILLHGDPGSGKTEFARFIASELKVQLFEADYEDEQGDSASTQERLSALLLAVRALKHRHDAVVLFDEAEDVFPCDFRRLYAPESEGKTPYAKAWMNRMLETLPVPVIWISNNIDAMDPAYLRRFLLHIQFRELPTPVKQRLTERYLGTFAVGHAFKEEIARLPRLTPAQLETASRLARLCHPEEARDAEEMIRLQIRGAREAAGLDYARSGRDAPIQYRSDFVNLREPMSVPVLIEGLRVNGRASVCFYGVPGTGKTELAHHIASQLGRELIYKSASDLLSPWVGMTEKNIARLFADAEDRSADVVVLLDEADTFLRDRASAQHSWEATQTNEFLARMERFPGIFICTTNLVDVLDSAVLRRFLFRVEFLPLCPEQCIAMFVATLGREPNESEMHELRRLSGLVPADFANVARQMRFIGEKSRSAPLMLLSEELRARCGSAAVRRSIGFTA